MDYDKLSDEELIALAKDGEEKSLNYLLEKNKNLIKSIAHGISLSADGIDTEDLIQDGMIAFYKAIRTFSPNGGANFKTYANTCIKNAMLSTLRRYNNTKNIPLLNYVPLDENLQIAVTSDPQDAVINSESLQEFYIKCKESLSKLEFEILKLYLEGYIYLDIALKIGKKEKSVDNAIQRIRKKIKTIINS
ncbi:MAG: sigma-70 family RNA polymerase sigma factor [Clostridiales bacterium]|nr:sigma-70 family RNA polymerase sigma factor [Clostridiales bacterium]